MLKKRWQCLPLDRGHLALLYNRARHTRLQRVTTDARHRDCSRPRRISPTRSCRNEGTPRRMPKLHPRASPTNGCQAKLSETRERYERTTSGHIVSDTQKNAQNQARCTTKGVAIRRDGSAGASQQTRYSSGSQGTRDGRKDQRAPDGSAHHARGGGYIHPPYAYLCYDTKLGIITPNQAFYTRGSFTS